MSGIYTPDMEMPTEVCFVNVMLCNDGRVFVYKNGEWEKIGNAIPVPDHGRLIDADVLSEKHKELAYELRGKNYDFHMTAKAWVDNAPTIIPADKE